MFKTNIQNIQHDYPTEKNPTDTFNTIMLFNVQAIDFFNRYFSIIISKPVAVGTLNTVQLWFTTSHSNSQGCLSFSSTWPLKSLTSCFPTWHWDAELGSCTDSIHPALLLWTGNGSESVKSGGEELLSVLTSTAACLTTHVIRRAEKYIIIQNITYDYMLYNRTSNDGHNSHIIV